MANKLPSKPKARAKPVKINWYEQPDKHKQLRYPALGICLLLFFILPFMSLQVGIPSDEPIDAAYGTAALKFYASAGKDTSFSDLTVLGNSKFPLQKYYGAGFETFTVGLSKLLGTPLFPTRHVITAFAGATLILFATLFTAELYGWLAALIAVLFLASSPTLIGNSLFNTKDVPFAMGFTVALFFFVRWIKQLPEFSVPAMIGCIAGIGISIGTRIGGILLIAYFLFFVSLYLFMNNDIKSSVFSTPAVRRKFFLHIAIISFGGFILGCCSYPNFFLHGLSHVSDALSIAKKFPVKISMLFKGELISSVRVPGDYIPVYMLITFPLQVLVGLLIFYLGQPWISKSISKWSVIVLLFCALFPVIYVITTNANVYNGWRHVMFAYPFFVSSAAIGFAWLYSRIKKQALQIALLVFPAMLVINTGIWICSNNPYQYIYYNELVGGVKGANTYYDTDYQQLAAFNSYQWLIASPEFKSKAGTRKLVCNNTGMLFYDGLKPDSVQLLTSKGYRDFIYQPWDFAILSTVFNPPAVVRYSYPDKETVHTETVGGVPVSCVIANPNDYSIKGLTFCNTNQVDSGLYYLEKVVADNPKNFRVWKPLANCYANKGNLDMALKYFELYNSLFPEDADVVKVINNIHGFKNSNPAK